MCGESIVLIACASRLSRLTLEGGPLMSAAALSWSNLIATRPPVATSTPSYTEPIPPEPIRRTRWHLSPRLSVFIRPQPGSDNFQAVRKYVIPNSIWKASVTIRYSRRQEHTISNCPYP
jgi:hypothetical protein